MEGVAKDILNPHVVCVTEDMEVRAVAQRLGQEAITGAPVVDARGRVVQTASKFPGSSSLLILLANSSGTI